MSRIETKDWKEFKLEDLFMISISLSVDKTAFEFDDSYDIDFIGRTSISNGIQGKLYELKYAPNEAGTYSVTQIGTKVCQYRENRWYASQNIFKLVPLDKAMNKASKFLTTVITQALKCTYSDDTYSSYPTLKNLRQQEIKLPVDDHENPDWNYMEDYIKNLEDKVKDNLDKFSMKNTSEKIDTRDWKEFKVGDLFDAERGKIKRLQSQNDGNTPVIAAGFSNQGIAGMYDVDAEYENKITISCNGVGCGSAFYHPYPFNLNGDAIVLTELKPMNDLVKQFISCMLNGVLTRKYSYEEKCSADKAKDATIKIPVDDNGEPDWVYMENFMKQIELIAKQKLDLLKVNEASFAG